MKQPESIIAGSFVIEPAPTELAEGLGALLGLQNLDGEPILPVDMRTLAAHSEAEIPPLFALALPLPTGMVWMIKGVANVAVLPVKEKHAYDPKKRDRVLVAWAATFTEDAALGLIYQAYGGMIDDADDDEVEAANDGSVHVTVELPLDGIDVHRAPDTDLNEWLDSLSDAAMAALDRVDADAEVILFDASEEDRPGIAGHISVFADDDEDAINLVTGAMTEALAGFTPVEDVRDRLAVEIEEVCLYSMLSDLMDGMDDTDLADFSD